MFNETSRLLTALEARRSHAAGPGQGGGSAAPGPGRWTRPRATGHREDRGEVEVAGPGGRDDARRTLERLEIRADILSWVLRSVGFAVGLLPLFLPIRGWMAVTFIAVGLATVLSGLTLARAPRHIDPVSTSAPEGGSDADTGITPAND